MTMMVGRTLSFLELFALQKRPLSGSDIARMLDIPTSSCHDVVRVLETRGYLYKSAEESEPGLTTLSCRFSRGSAVYIVTVAGPTPRFQPNVTQACQLLTQLCGQLGERG